MNDILEFLTSKEGVIVYIVAGMACLVCLIIYIVEKNNGNLRKKHNTKELNKLVEKIKEEYPEETKQEVYSNEPVMQVVEEEKKEAEVSNVIENVSDISSDNNAEEEELQYTTIEPDRETAKLELQRITEELIKKEEQERIEEQKLIEEQERLEKQEKQEEITEIEKNESLKDTSYYEPQIIAQIPVEEDKNIKLTDYEVKQEENAIISLDELVSKGKEIYEANEITQYQDEGNEPISIQDLERTMELKLADYNEPFIIANVVSENDETKIVATEEGKKFKNSPIISPIYGIEKDNEDNNSLSLENTADYDKLDNEIKRTNEFLMTLKELQKKLD